MRPDIRRSLALITSLIVLGCSRGPQADPKSPPDSKWRSEIFTDFEPLSNQPVVTGKAEFGRVTVRNDRETTLIYSAAGPSGIQLFQERDAGGRWELKNWDWCGTGKETFAIEPSESATFDVDYWDEKERERMLGWFVEKGTLRGGMVPLACEP